MIAPFPSDDHETPIEEFPGYLGMEWDREFRPGPDLSAISPALWKRYIGALVEEDISRAFLLNLPTGALTVRVHPSDWLANLFEQLPAFTVYVDRGPPDAGPASGFGYIFTLAKEATINDIHVSTKALGDAIRADLTRVRELQSRIPPPEAYAFDDTHVLVEIVEPPALDESFVFGGGGIMAAPAGIGHGVRHAESMKPSTLIDRSAPPAASQESVSPAKKGRQVRVISDREESSMASCWTVYLCLQSGDSKPFRLFNGRWSEYLGEREEYPYNEKAEEYKIPRKINGIKVREVDDGMILGGDLIWENNSDVIEFSNVESPETKHWLRENRWDFPGIEVELQRAMKSIKRRGITTAANKRKAGKGGSK